MYSFFKIILTCCFFFFIHCFAKIDYSEYKALNKKWSSGKSICFSIDSINLYTPSNVYILLRNNNDYPFSNIFLIAQLKDSVKTIFVDTLEYEMADFNGRWLGKGISNIKESKLWLKEKYHFPHYGPFKIEIKHAVRSKLKHNDSSFLKGITDIGIAIEQYKNIK